jgi:hypothetical protein
MPYHDFTLKIIKLPDDSGTINSIWGVAIGDSLLSYFCSFCNIIWNANFPRQQMVRIAEDADKFPCPGCVKMILKQVDNEWKNIVVN